MTSSIRQAIRGWLAPAHRLSCSGRLWRSILAELRRRGANVRESGAFLLGHVENGRREVRAAAYYDDLDPHALDTGIIRFRGAAFGLLWDLCQRTSLAVVADVHTHPGTPGQSRADATHPMISQPGHFSLIVPAFARQGVRRADLGLYEYLGEHRWRNHSGATARDILYFGWWG